MARAPWTSQLVPTGRGGYRQRMRLFALALLATQAVVASAQTAPLDTAVSLTVTLDRADWRYHVGDSARFRITLARAGKPIPGARVQATLGPVRMPGHRVDTLDLSKGSATVVATSGKPDFIRLTAQYRLDDTTLTQLATAGFDPERLRSPIDAPADLMEFWNRAIADARRVPLDAKMTRMAQWSTPEVDVYHVNFQNHRAGSRLYGILSMPAKPGKYPAMLVVPGAGVRPYFPSVATARRGVIHLAIGIHGIPVDRDSLFYNELRGTALQRYYTYNLDDRDEYYYKRVYVGAVRAGDFLFSLPQFDGTNYVVQGGSQGGGLSIVTAVLDPRVKAIASSYPAMSDQLGYRQGRAGGWPHVFQDTTRMSALREKLETIRYYDVINFARLLRVPGIYAWGYNDNVVPPSASWATWNTITAPKESLIVPETAHNRVKSQTDRMDAWLLEKLGAR